MSTLPNAILPFFLPFYIIFRTSKTFSKMGLLFLGAILCRTGRTVCACLKVLGVKGEQAFANYHHVLGRCKWDSVKGVEVLIKLILPLMKGELLLIADEHLERRNGKRIKNKDLYRDPVASSRNWLIKRWGIKWVVVAVAVYFPWSKRPFALPIFSVPRRPPKHPLCKNRNCRSGTDILCQILFVIRRKFPDLSITLVGDGDYARVKLAQTCIRLCIGLVTRLRADARLYEFPKKKWRGKAVKLGHRISFSMRKRKWEKGVVRGYGGKKKQVKWEAYRSLWHAGKPEVTIPLLAVWVQLRADDELLLMSTDTSLSPEQVIEAYIKRWNIEVTFRECREHLGIETQRQWSDQAIERTTPLLFCLYSLVVLIGHGLYLAGGIKNKSTAWHRKKSLTFSDLLASVRMEIWKHRGHLNSAESSSSQKGSLSDTATLEELLAECF
ncbi:MAG: transposase [Simkania negevensis]|nr:transposase [Simkania negevensis]